MNYWALTDSDVRMVMIMGNFRCCRYHPQLGCLSSSKFSFFFFPPLLESLDIHFRIGTVR